MKTIKESIFFILCGVTFLLCGASLCIIGQSRKEITKNKEIEKELYLSKLHQNDQIIIGRLEEELVYQAETFDTTCITLSQYIVDTSKNKTSQEEAINIVLRCKETFKNTDVDFRWMLAILNRESQFISDAYNPNDPAKGICQITQPCLDSYNKSHNIKYSFDDMYDIDKCLDVGLWYFKDLCSSFDTVAEAVSAYNQGVSGVKKRGVDGTRYFGYIESHFIEICSISNSITNLLGQQIELVMR